MGKKKLEKEKAKKLSSIELARIENNSLKLDIIKTRIEICKMRDHVNGLQKNLLRKDIELAESKGQSILSEFAELRANAEKQHEINKKYMLELREKYMLPEKWGFNQDTGNIVIEV